MTTIYPLSSMNNKGDLLRKYLLLVPAKKLRKIIICIIIIYYLFTQM